jgi:hypothetical protein
LEIESNFFTGALPFLEQMPELTYVYLRRNNLSSHLNFLKGRRLTNLFSIWLDGNDITKTIPTQIGELTTLASISITNASLTGTIPTELAILPLLNRIWLYGNDLNGTVPEALANITKLQIWKFKIISLQEPCPREFVKIYASPNMKIRHWWRIVMRSSAMIVVQGVCNAMGVVEEYEWVGGM